MAKKTWGATLLLIGLLAVTMAWFSLVRAVEGQVRDAETGQPLPQVAVSVAGQNVVTDAHGNFQVRGIRGLPEVQAQLPGYRPASTSLLTASLIGIRHTIALALEPVELRGTVTDAASKAPLAGATIRAGEQEGQADEQGRYVVKRLLPGTRISARATYYRESDPLIYEGQAVQDLSLDLLPVTVTVRDLYTNKPLPGAAVSAAGETRETDAQGQVTFARLSPQTEIVATLKAYDESRGRASPGDRLVLGLRPTTIRGAVRNQKGEPLANALVLARIDGQEPRLTYTNAAGEFTLEGIPPEASLLVRMAGYHRVERQLRNAPGADFELEPFVAKGIYCAFHMLKPKSAEQLRANLDLIDRTELNAIVFEVKAETGWLAWQPKLKIAQEIGAYDDTAVDIKQVLAECKRRNIYTIARMPVFIDHMLATKHPEWAVKRSNGTLFKDWGENPWMDPFRKEVWDYNIALAKEVVELGFDEIQFDYLRFPSDATLAELLDARFLQESTKESRPKAIADFVAYARQELDKTGCFFSADLFGLTTFDRSEQGIGQLMEMVAPHVDYVSPMVYPSTYLPGMLNIYDPWRKPYEVVKESMLAVKQRTTTLQRPWLQHYDDYHGVGIKYGIKEYRLQKQAAEEGGAYGWLFWNIWGVYDPGAFDP